MAESQELGRERLVKKAADFIRQNKINMIDVLEKLGYVQHILYNKEDIAGHVRTMYEMPVREACR